MTLVRRLNGEEKIHGILVQLPLPAHLDEHEVLLAIDPKKDVDAFHPVNVGRIMIGDYDFLPCTPAGVMALLEKSGISPEGKEVVVVGRSNIVGKPQAMLMLHANATVTICHSQAPEIWPGSAAAPIFLLLPSAGPIFLPPTMSRKAQWSSTLG